jgi:mono/diheme cytochrome c family protein
VAKDYLKGKQIFAKFCIGCHAPLEKHVTNQYVFDNLFGRLPKTPEEYFRKFIQDSREMKASGDKHLQESAKEFSSNYDHVFQDEAVNFGVINQDFV